MQKSDLIFQKNQFLQYETSRFQQNVWKQDREETTKWEIKKCKNLGKNRKEETETSLFFQKNNIFVTFVVF